MEPNQDTGQVADSERGELIERMVLDIVHRKKLTKVGDVVVNIQRLDRFVTTDEIHEAVKRLERRSEINLAEEHISPSFLRNLVDAEANAPFWIAMISTIAFLATAFTLPEGESWIALKRVIAAVFLFAIPGYVMTNTLIPRNRLSYVERLAISTGMSLAVLSVIGIILAYGVAGIRLGPIVVSVSAFVVSVAVAGAYRDFVRRHQARLSHHRFLDKQKGSRKTA